MCALLVNANRKDINSSTEIPSSTLSDISTDSDRIGGEDAAGEAIEICQTCIWDFGSFLYFTFLLHFIAGNLSKRKTEPAPS